jgi:hypothetical protein
MGRGSAPGAVTLDDGGTDGRTQEGPRGGGRDLAGEVSDAATDTASGGDLTTAHGDANGRNVTNEANFYGDASTSESKKIVEVTAKSVVGPGLDNLRTKPVLAVGRGEDGAVDDSTSAVLRPESGTAPGTPLTPALSPVSGQWSVDAVDSRRESKTRQSFKRRECNFREWAIYYDLDGCMDHRNDITARHPGMMIRMRNRSRPIFPKNCANGSPHHSRSIKQLLSAFSADRTGNRSFQPENPA